MFKLVKDYEGSQVLIAQIDSTKERCILVSPYVQLWGHVKSALERALGRDVSIVAFIRKPETDKDRDKTKEIAKDFEKLGIELFTVPNLHAKIYAFDDSAIVSSMNLYDFSQSNSIELSILIEKEPLVDEIKTYITEHIHRCAEPFEQKAQQKGKIKEGSCKYCGKSIKYPAWGNPVCRECYTKREAEEKQRAGGRENGQGILASFVKAVGDTLAQLGGDRGFCIRCGTAIENDPARPLCDDCYKKWAQYKRPAFTEKYCLACGKPSRTSYAKPYCIDCYRNG